MAEQKKYRITEAKKAEYEAELKNLTTVEMPQCINDVNTARALGDLSENADYDAARKRQAELNRRIGYLTDVLNNCDVIQGTILEFKHLGNGKTYKFLIVGNSGANPLDATTPTIPEDSPVAIAVKGHKVGDVVTVNVANKYDIEILSI